MDDLQLAQLAVDRRAYGDGAPESLQPTATQKPRDNRQVCKSGASFLPFHPASWRQITQKQRSKHAPRPDAQKRGCRLRSRLSLEREDVEFAHGRTHDAEHGLQRVVEGELEALLIRHNLQAVLCQAKGTTSKEFSVCTGFLVQVTWPFARKNAVWWSTPPHTHTHSPSVDATYMATLMKLKSEYSANLTCDALIVTGVATAAFAAASSTVVVMFTVFGSSGPLKM